MTYNGTIGFCSIIHTPTHDEININKRIRKRDNKIFFTLPFSSLHTLRPSQVSTDFQTETICDQYINIRLRDLEIINSQLQESTPLISSLEQINLELRHLSLPSTDQDIFEENLNSEPSQPQDTNLIHIYTDGSCNLRNPDNMMGCGWIITNTPNPITFFCKTILWPSSTRAELTAIWTALLALPSHANAIIHTDSQAALDGIKKCSSIFSLKQGFTLTNRN